MGRVLTGVKPTGDLHLGNFFGTMQGWPEFQTEHESFFFVADLHALNDRPDPADLRRRSVEMVAWLLAMGVDPLHSRVYIESQIPAISELFAILNNYVTMGELSRMTQFKDKSRKGGDAGQVVGLFEYPVLMAADILLFDTEIVPVGEDQIQHLELTRDIASRVNNQHGEVFVLPEGRLRRMGARIMSLQDPERKMSKSDAASDGCIYLLDDADTIRRKVKRAVTDSGTEIVASEDKPALANLLALHSLASGRSIEELQEDYAGKGYGAFKEGLAESLVELLAPIRERYEVLIKDRAEVDEVIAAGRVQAALIAEEKLDQVKRAVGLL